jgi:FkbM family methyltransferase
LSKSIARFLVGAARLATVWMKPLRASLTRARVAEYIAPVLTVETPGGPLRFFAGSARAIHDPAGMYRDEPETVRWLDSLPADAVLWDIGANVGVYALYAAKVRGLRVLAFEPSAATLAVLVRNIELNGLAERVDAYGIALSDKTGLDYLYMAHTEAGHSMHAFAQAETVAGALRPKFKQAVAGFAADDFCPVFEAMRPRFIKLDVDSIEPLILDGAKALLGTVESLLVEVEGENGAAIEARLHAAGFVENTTYREGARRNRVYERPQPAARA